LFLIVGGVQFTSIQQDAEFGVGDVVGFGIIHSPLTGNGYTELFLTINGRYVGKVNESSPKFHLFPWYPIIGTDCHCAIECNFGTKGIPFVFDLISFEADYPLHKFHRWSVSSSSSSPADDVIESAAPLNKVVVPSSTDRITTFQCPCVQLLFQHQSQAFRDPLRTYRMYLDDETRPTFRNDFMIKYCDRIRNRMRFFDIYDIEDDDEDDDDEDENDYEGEEEFDEEDFDFDVMDDEDEFDVDEDDELFEGDVMNLEWNQQDDATDYGYDDDGDADHDDDDDDDNNNDIQEENNGGILMHGWQTGEDGVLGESTQDEQVIGCEGENNVFDNIQMNRDYYYENDDDDDDDDDDAYQSDGIDFD
jgi:hypothetical protein